MDEEALRAMMPLSFGKRGPKKTSKPQQQAPQSGPDNTNRPATSLSQESIAQSSKAPETSTAPSTSLNGKRKQDAVQEPEEEDDGLTAEERAANAAIEQRMQERGSDDSDDSSDEDDIGPQPASASTSVLSLPPMENEAVFTGHHSKTLSALAIDQSGARFCVGSYDYNLSLYDFGGMNAALAPFRSFEPAESYPVYDVAFSADSRNVLVVSGTAQAKVFSRDGVDLGTCKKGDPYLRDMRNTTGHISDLSCGKCHPTEAGVFVTGGSDSTIRLWDLATMERGQTDIIVLKSKTRGNRTKVTSVQYSADGLRVFGAALDGSLSYWDTRSNLNAKPRGTVEAAHTAGTVTSSIAVSGPDDNLIATRGGDDTVKLWDLRSFKTPLGTARDLPNTSAHMDVIFDPLDGGSLLTCVSALPLDRKGNVVQITGATEEDSEEGTSTNTTGGKIAVLSPSGGNLDVVKQYSVSAASPVRLAWCAPTNQLFTTFRDGSLRVFYDATSTKGVTMAVARAPRARTPWSSADTPLAVDQIYTPGADNGPYEPSDSAKRRKLAKIRQDPIASHLPQRPVDGVGRGGRIGSAFNTHIVQNMYNNQASVNEDPREALLKYAEPKDE